MLTWKGEAFSADTSVTEYFTMLMEAREHDFELFECFFCDYVPSNNVTEVDECGYCSNDVIIDVAFDSVQVDLTSVREYDLFQC
jgi:hypothetical protein